MRNNFAKQNSSYQNHSLLATIILILSVVALLIGYVWRVNVLTRRQCYTELSVATREATEELENNFRNDRVNLRMLASVIAEEGSLDYLKISNYLSIYNVNSLISNVGILTPENTCIQLRGAEISADGIMNYSEEILRGEHISSLQPSLTNANSLVIRSFMPIRKSGKTIGLLYSEMSPSNIARAWSPSIYNGTCTFCIINRETGEFLVNNWNREIRNLSELESTSLMESILAGKTAFREMKAETGESMYLSYMPMELENWEILVSVSESEVFASTRNVQKAMLWFLGGECALLIVYLLFMLHINHRSVISVKKQANIDVLTGLQNRNEYEAYCQKIQNHTKDLVCIYLDANGLHEINNTKGHLAGDQMLRYIADTLKVQFGENEVYRIGGDEFVVFQQKKTQQEIERALQHVHEEIERNTYHVSSGFCIGTQESLLKDIIKTAEVRMYEEKRKYYEKIGQSVRNNIKEKES